MNKNIIKINIDNFFWNYQIVLDYVKNKTEYTVKGNKPQLWQVLKGNAYGIGQNEIVRKLLQNNQNNYFVFCLDEALQIKQQDKKNEVKNLCVLIGNKKGEEDIFLKNNLIPVINSEEQLNSWLKVGKKENKKLPCVLQFNTGMNRNGIDVGKIENIKNILKNNSELNVIAIMSHLGCASMPESDMCLQQFNNWEIIRKNFPNIKKALPGSEGIFYKYKSNEDIIKNHKGITDICRLGTMVFGGLQTCINEAVNNNELKNDVKLRPVLNLISYLKNDLNGYYFPIGCKHGFSQEYCLNGKVIINGKKYNIKFINNDKTYINIEKSNVFKKKEKVLILGETSTDFISIDEFAKFNNTNVVEIQKRLVDNLILYPKEFKKELIDRDFDNKFVKNNYKPKYYLSNIKKIDNNDLQYETQVLETNIINEKGGIGYDAISNVENGDFICSLFNGYDDVFPRILNGKNFKIPVYNVDDEKIMCKIYGKISMDQTTLLIPDNQKNKIKIGCKCIIKFSEIRQLVNNCEGLNDFTQEEKNNLVREIKLKMLSNRRCLIDKDLRYREIEKINYENKIFFDSTINKSKDKINLQENYLNCCNN